MKNGIVLENFIEYCDKMTIANESFIDILPSIGAGIILTFGFSIPFVTKRLENRRLKREQTEKNKVYDTVYILDTKEYSKTYPLSKHYTSLGLSKNDTLFGMGYTVPSKVNKNNKTIIISKSFFDKMMQTKVYLYSLDGKVVGIKRWVNSSDLSSIPIKNVESGTFKELCTKNGITVASYDDSFKDDRLKVYNNIYKQLNTVAKKYKSDMLSISVASKDELDINDFIYDMNNNIDLLYVKYRFKTNDIDEFHDNSEAFNKEIDNVINELNKMIPDGFTIDQDWDKWEGTIYLVAKEK